MRIAQRFFSSTFDRLDTTFYNKDTAAESRIPAGID